MPVLLSFVAYRQCAVHNSTQNIAGGCINHGCSSLGGNANADRKTIEYVPVCPSFSIPVYAKLTVPLLSKITTCISNAVPPPGHHRRRCRRCPRSRLLSLDSVPAAWSGSVERSAGLSNQPQQMRVEPTPAQTVSTAPSPTMNVLPPTVNPSALMDNTPAYPQTVSPAAPTIANSGGGPSRIRGGVAGLVQHVVVARAISWFVFLATTGAMDEWLDGSSFLEFLG